MPSLEWSPLTRADLDDLLDLATDCLAHDGGLPQLATPEYLERLFLSGEGIGGREDTGDLVAAGGLSWDGSMRRTASGLVAPSLRRQGVGEELVRWCRAQAENQPLRALVENVSPEAEALLTEAGMRRVFAETVMRHRLRHIPTVPLPDGLRTEAFGEATAGAFHTAYRRSFADRPGFPNTPMEEWLVWLRSDPDFTPKHSRVALAADGEPVGFVTLAGDWIEQVGVVPEHRGRGLGAHLVVRSLRLMRREGYDTAWLCVNVDNPSRELYERLGFRASGTRARYEDLTAHPPEE
ncbi:MAG TPA: GNAT family N-acetyltransferase [Dermatophilaceae bacterium]|nr:GNAT family N-acetyltransferase [Dermatophilaceae bacterium]